MSVFVEGTTSDLCRPGVVGQMKATRPRSSGTSKEECNKDSVAGEDEVAVTSLAGRVKRLDCVSRLGVGAAGGNWAESD